MLKKRYLISLLIVMSTFLSACNQNDIVDNQGNKSGVKIEKGAEETKKESDERKAKKLVEDLSGEKVEIPNEIKSVAVLTGPAFEKVILLNSVDKASITGNKMGSKGWAKLVCPEYAQIPITENAMEPNIEELLEKKAEVAFYWDTNPKVKQMLEDAGIKVIVTQLGKQDINSEEQFIEIEKKEMNAIAEILGGNAPTIAKKWSEYIDKKVAYVKEKLKNVDQSSYPKVYYVRGPEALKTHGGASYTNWLVKLAGGKLITDNTDKLLFDTTMEEVIKENPEYIFMGRVDNIELIKDDPNWAGIKAVQDGNIFLDPAGVGPIDYSSEGFLLILKLSHTRDFNHE